MAMCYVIRVELLALSLLRVVIGLLLYYSSSYYYYSRYYERRPSIRGIFRMRAGRRSAALAIIMLYTGNGLVRQTLEASLQRIG